MDLDLEFIRTELQQIKEEQGINFNYFAKQIGLKEGSFYNFTSGNKRLSEEKIKLLKNEIKRFLPNVFL